MGAAEATETEGATPVTLDEARAWSGHRLDEISGSHVGKIEGVMVDAETERPEWLLARMGRFGHHTVVPARDAVEGVGHVWVPYTRDQIRRAPKTELGSSLNRETERELLAHYRMAGDAGRYAELEKREPEAITARPAS
jgi:hypothetical protein